MKRFSLYGMSCFYILAGIYHFVNPAFYRKIMPPYLPWHDQLIYFTGVLEILFGALLLQKHTRKFAAWCIIILLIIIFPANVQMMINYKRTENPALWLAIARLPLQILLIGWAYNLTRKR